MKKNILLFITIISFIFLINGALQFNALHAEVSKSENLRIKILSDTGSANINDNKSYVQDIPENYLLLQNYPNPFNPTTTLKYALPQTGYITVKVYNSLGNEVKTLVDEIQSAGLHEAVFNGEDLSSGVYFAQLKAGSVIKVIKMILLK